MFSAPTSGCSFWTVLHYLVTCSSEAEEEKWMTMPRMSRMRQEWEVFLLTNLGGLFLNLCNDEEAGSDVEHWNSAQLHQSINVYCPQGGGPGPTCLLPPVLHHWSPYAAIRPLQRVQNACCRSHPVPDSGASLRGSEGNCSFLPPQAQILCLSTIACSDTVGPLISVKGLLCFRIHSGGMTFRSVACLREMPLKFGRQNEANI